MLDFTGVNGNMLFKAVQSGKFAIANGAHEKSGIILYGG
jgi:hypothetical protein